LPGSCTACRYTERSPPGSDQRCEQVGLHVLAGDEQDLRLPSGDPGRLHEVLTLGDEQPELVAPALLLELADGLELLVVG
jgi:hypothetical protein